MALICFVRTNTNELWFRNCETATQRNGSRYSEPMTSHAMPNAGAPASTSTLRGLRLKTMMSYQKSDSVNRCTFT